jgi:hypothetical protein
MNCIYPGRRLAILLAQPRTKDEAEDVFRGHNRENAHTIRWTN